MYSLIQDLYLSVRALRRNPEFTIVAVLTLTLGIAGPSIIFTLINSSVLMRLPYPDPDRLVILRWQNQAETSARAFFLIKRQAHSYSSLAASYPTEAGVNLSATGSPNYVHALSVSKNFFQVLGVFPFLGRTFSEEEDQPHAPRIVILSYELWTQKFNRDSSAIGSELYLNGESIKIVGVMPSGFQTYPNADIWLPLQLVPGGEDPGSNYRIMGRLSPGVSRRQAQFELDNLAAEYQLTYLPSAKKGRLLVDDLHSFLVSGQREGLTVLFAAVALVFLIACTNVAVLTLVRAAETTPAIAIRSALGASRNRLVISRLTESLMISLIGGLLGLILTKESLPLVLSLWPSNAPPLARLAIDGRVVLFTFTISVLSPVLFGLLPALKLSRVNISEVLARTSRAASASAEQVRALRLLVGGQIALTTILLAGTMLLVKSLVNLYSVPLGFDYEHLTVAHISLAGDQYATTHSTDRLLRDVIQQLQSMPDVDGAAAVDGLPLQSGLNLPVRPLAMPALLDHADEYRPVTPDYFRTLGIPLRSGRYLDSEDTTGSAPVTVINETMARHWWQNASPLGSYIKVDEELGPQPSDVPRQVVGVVADIHEKGSGLPPPPTMFIPLSQTPDNINAFFNKVFLSSLVVRGGNHIDLSDRIRRAIQSVDPDLPLASSSAFSQVVNRSFANLRFIALVTAVFSFFALLLTTVGIHGLLNYQARLRLGEIAIRMALGASRAQILRMVVRQGIKLVFFALLAGLAGSALIEKLLTPLLYNVGSYSLIVIVGTTALLGLLATLISFLAAARASSIEPMAVLRNE